MQRIQICKLNYDNSSAIARWITIWFIEIMDMYAAARLKKSERKSSSFFSPVDILSSFELLTLWIQREIFLASLSFKQSYENAKSPVECNESYSFLYDSPVYFLSQIFFTFFLLYTEHFPCVTRAI